MNFEIVNENTSPRSKHQRRSKRSHRQSYKSRRSQRQEKQLQIDIIDDNYQTKKVVDIEREEKLHKRVRKLSTTSDSESSAYKREEYNPNQDKDLLQYNNDSDVSFTGEN